MCDASDSSYNVRFFRPALIQYVDLTYSCGAAEILFSISTRCWLRNVNFRPKYFVDELCGRVEDVAATAPALPLVLMLLFKLVLERDVRDLVAYSLATDIIAWRRFHAAWFGASGAVPVLPLTVESIECVVSMMIRGGYRSS